MENSFVLITGNNEVQSVLLVLKVQLLFHLNTQMDSRETKHVFLRYMERISALE